MGLCGVGNSFGDIDVAEPPAMPTLGTDPTDAAPSVPLSDYFIFS